MNTAIQDNRGLDYRGALSQASEASAEKQRYVLRVGSTELEPISHETLAALGECSHLIDSALESCFLERPDLWAALGSVDADVDAEQLREIETSLGAIGQCLEERGTSGYPVLERIMALWRASTHDALAKLEGGPLEEFAASTTSVLAEYRSSAFAFIEALVQMLPTDDPCAIAGRRRLEEGRTQLASFLHVAPEDVGPASWRVAGGSRLAEDPSFVTWGIP